MTPEERASNLGNDDCPHHPKSTQCNCITCVAEAITAALEAENAELQLHSRELTEVLENRNRTIAELERLGDAMESQVRQWEAFGNKGISACLDAWRKLRAASTEAK